MDDSACWEQKARSDSSEQNRKGSWGLVTTTFPTLALLECFSRAHGPKTGDAAAVTFGHSSVPVLTVPEHGPKVGRTSSGFVSWCPTFLRPHMAQYRSSVWCPHHCVTWALVDRGKGTTECSGCTGPILGIKG